MQRASFYIEGPTGAFEESYKIAKYISEFLESDEGKKYSRVA